MNLPVPTFQPNPETTGRRRYGQAALRDLIEAMLRRPRMTLAAAAAVALLVLVAGLLQPRLYTSTAAVMISPRAQPVGDRTLMPTEAIASALVDSEIEIIRSPQLAERLIDYLDLTRDRAWGGLPGAAPISVSRRQRVISKVRRAIGVRRQGSTYVAEVSATASTPARARQMATMLVELYFAGHLQRSTEGMGTADRWLTQRLNQMRAEARAAEDEAVEFRTERGLAARGETQETQAAILAARADLADKEVRLRQGPATSLQSDAIRELRAREANAAHIEIELSNRYGDQHPKLQAARAEREKAQAQIQSETSRISARLSQDVEAARLRLAELEKGLAESNDANAANARMQELERVAAAAAALDQSNLLRQQEIAQQGRQLFTSVAQVAPASTPARSNSPNIALLLLVAVGFGLLSGAGVAYLVALTDHTLHDLDDVERGLGQRGLVAIANLPRSALRSIEGADRSPAGYAAAKPSSAFAEAFRLLQKSIFSARVQERLVVAITPALSGDGASSTALALARTVAISGKSVVLVNCDPRPRASNGALRMTPLQGLNEVLTSATPWSDVVIADASGARILPRSFAQFTPTDVFAGSGMQRLLSELREAFDLVVLDCAPVLAAAETRSLVRLADATIIVARAEKTPRTAVASAIEQVRHAGGAILGVALNGARTRRSEGHILFDPRGFRMVDKDCAEAA